MMTSAVFKNASADKEMLFSQDLPDADFQRCAATLSDQVVPAKARSLTWQKQANVLFLMPCLLLLAAAL